MPSVFCKQVPVLGKYQPAKAEPEAGFFLFWRKRAVGSMTWGKMGRELGPVSPARTVFSWKAFPKRATWGGLLSPAREPAASWP